MEDYTESINDQSGMLINKAEGKMPSNLESSSRFISQSEGDDSCSQSEMSKTISGQNSQGKYWKRNIKARQKDKDSFDDSSSKTESRGSGSKHGKRKQKKTEQYKNQIIVDQYGTFEYDKDPEGYKKARKRQQNRESALRARDKRANKMETVESKLGKIWQKSVNLEKENLVLKAEKKQLQDQVQNLLSIITSFGQHKRFKTTEVGLLGESIKDLSVENKSTDKEGSSGAVTEEKDIAYLDQEFEQYESLDLSPKGDQPEKTFLKLIRNNEDSLFEQDERGSSHGDLFQKGMMLSLTIVMWMILCLTGFSISNSIQDSALKIWTTCKAPRNPFELRSADSKTLMSHPSDPHYEYNGMFEKVSDATSMFNVWVGVFFMLIFMVFLFKKSIFSWYHKFFTYALGDATQSSIKTN